MNIIIASDNALVDLDQAKQFLRITLDDQDDLVQDLVNRASDYCEWHAQRPLRARAFQDLRLPGQIHRRLRPRATPIDPSQTIALALDGVTQTVWTAESDGDPADFDVIVGSDVPGLGRPNHFYRAAGWLADYSTTPFPIRLSYTGGFDPVPGDLIEAALLVFQHLYRLQQRQTTDLTGYSSPVAGSVSYAPELMGSLIPMQAKQILDSYRLWA